MADRIIDEPRTAVPLPHVIGAFLRAEAYKFDQRNYALTEEDRRAINSRDYTSADDNVRRERLLLQALGRAGIFQFVPRDTQWFEICLRNNHLNELLVIPVYGWLNLSSRGLIQLRTDPQRWEPPILWSHDWTGPFTILEGNTRLIAHAQRVPLPPLEVPAYVGLSASRSHWHLTDSYQILR
jgi:hypothetical protein